MLDRAWSDVEDHLVRRNVAGAGNPVGGVRFEVLRHYDVGRKYDLVAHDRARRVALIELDEGPIMLSNVVAVDNATLAVGFSVAVAFEAVDDDLSIPVFKPIS